MKRTYGHEPILLASSPITQHSQITQTKTKRNWHKLVLVVAAVIIVGTGATALLLRKPADASSQQFLRQLGSSVAFSLYAPTWLPEGWFMDKQSLSVTSEVVTFTVNAGKGQRLVFTEQPKPPQDNLDMFYNQQLSGSISSESAAGQVTTGQFEGSAIAGISADQTWILIRAVSTVDQLDFDRLVRSLKKIE